MVAAAVVSTVDPLILVEEDILIVAMNVIWTEVAPVADDLMKALAEEVPRKQGIMIRADLATAGVAAVKVDLIAPEVKKASRQHHREQS